LIKIRSEIPGRTTARNASFCELTGRLPALLVRIMLNDYESDGIWPVWQQGAKDCLNPRRWRVMDYGFVDTSCRAATATFAHAKARLCLSVLNHFHCNAN
jgi:hypothetical protein